MEEFRRVEIKYLIDENKYKNLKEELNSYIKPDLYFKSIICNIYFDNDNYELINKSIDKPIYKEKVRLRSYNIPNSNSDVYLEVKKKYEGVVGKRRIKAKLKDINDYLYNNKKLDESVNYNEINNVIKRNNLRPKIYVAYDREAYVGIENKSLRITFDSNLRTRSDNLDLSKGDNGILYFDKPMYIVEIKTLDSIPLFLSNILTKLKIYPTSFSKVGSIYEKGSLINV